MTADIPNMEPMRPIKRGRLCRGMTWVIMTVAPFWMPADPIPAMARPTINEVELGAAPQTAEPISKITTAAKKSILVE
jgi:hypothetical protein